MSKIVQILAVTLVALTCAEAYGLNQKTLVVSFDGFRQIYFDNNRFLPWFRKFRASGVYAASTRAIFPSETFPNHWSIATGMYSESHGITSNNMYDPNFDESFTMSNLDLKWWGAAEPIWVTARRQGKKTSASFWPGSAVVFPDNMTPNYYRKKYDNSVPFQTRIDETVKYLSENDVDLGFIYFNQPDNSGHHSGTGTEETSTQLQLMDWYLSYMLTSFEEVGLGEDNLNIIIVSDHGMTTVKERLNLMDYLDTDKYVDYIPNYGAMMNLQPVAGTADYVYQELKKGADKTGKFSVYKKESTPAEYHYSKNDRICDIVLVSKNGYFMAKYYSPSGNAATHGYDPAERHMQPMFMARGPAFKTGGYKASKVFETKDIYSIIAYAAGVEPTRNNATFDDVANIFA